MKTTFIIKTRKSTSKLGNTYGVDHDNLLVCFNEMIEIEKIKISEKVKYDNEKFEWDKEPNMSTNHGLAKYFIKNFYIKYRGNPSQNGGHFNFSEGDKGDIKEYKNIIRDTLSCSNLSRDWGYGRNQLAYKYVKEDIETSTKFVDYLIEYNVVDLDEYILNDGSYGEEEGEKLQTYGKAILLYLIRSKNYNKANEFLRYGEEFKNNVASELKGFYSYAERVSIGFIDRLHETQLEGWVEALEIEIETYLYLSKLKPTAFLDKYGADDYHLRDYEKFKLNDLNSALNIVNDKGDVTIVDNWKVELRKLFKLGLIIKRIK